MEGIQPVCNAWIVASWGTSMEANVRFPGNIVSRLSWVSAVVSCFVTEIPHCSGGFLSSGRRAHTYPQAEAQGGAGEVLWPHGGDVQRLSNTGRTWTFLCVCNFFVCMYLQLHICVSVDNLLITVFNNNTRPIHLHGKKKLERSTFALLCFPVCCRVFRGGLWMKRGSGKRAKLTRTRAWRRLPLSASSLVVGWGSSALS